MIEQRLEATRSLWHDSCLTCENVLKEYKDDGAKFIMRSLYDLYEAAMGIMRRCISQGFENLHLSDSQKVLHLAHSQMYAQSLSRLKDQLELQAQNEGNQVEHSPASIDIEENKIPVLISSISELISEHQRFSKAFITKFNMDAEFLTEEHTRNVFTRMKEVAESIGQHSCANEIGCLFYNVQGPEIQVLNEAPIAVNQDLMRRSQEKMDLSPFALLYAHLPNAPFVPLRVPKIQAPSSILRRSKIALEKLSREAFEFYLSPEVPVLECLPSPLEFYRSYAAANRPVVIRNALNSWPALTKWSIAHFKDRFGRKNVTMTLTPNGYADAITDGYFVLPEERVVPMGDFLDLLENPVDGRIPYIQKQNSNLIQEFPELLADSASDFEWASEVFGSQPDAVNFWMGDERAVTSMHKDPYENIYCVVSGWKEFILHPPTDQPWIPYQNYPTAHYEEVDGHLRIVPDEEGETIPWISIDPLKPDLVAYPDYAKATQVKCTVHKGDILYLPSLWFHHVRQSHACIAVNFWYDMQYDIKYNYFEFVRELIQGIQDRGSNV